MDINTATSGGQSADGRKMYDLNFTAEGAYIGIAYFLADLQDDSFLEFKIENFALTKGESTENLKATFVVKDIPIKIDNLSTDTSDSVETTGTVNNTNNTTGNTINNSSTNRTSNSNTNTNTTR